MENWAGENTPLVFAKLGIDLRKLLRERRYRDVRNEWTSDT